MLIAYFKFNLAIRKFNKTISKLILSAKEQAVLNVIDLACNINESVKYNEPFEIMKSLYRKYFTELLTSVN